jgi:Transposase DDE domain
MDLDTLIVTVFCLIDDALITTLDGKPLRQRGPQPQLCDSEVLTMETVGEYLGLDQDKAMFCYFRRHFAEFFPVLRRIHRTTFARQAANLWRVKERLWQQLVPGLKGDRAISLIDSFPVPVCRFARAPRCRRLRAVSAYGYDELAHQTFFGVRAHLRVCWPGVIVGLHLSAANVHELPVAERLLEGARGWALGDRNYWSPVLSEKLARQGLRLFAPYRSAKREKKRWPLLLVQTRRRIETVIGQLVERFQAKKVWARDRWHFFSRWLRKVLAHTIFVALCQQHELLPLRFAELVTI